MIVSIRSMLAAADVWSFVRSFFSSKSSQHIIKKRYEKCSEFSFYIFFFYYFMILFLLLGVSCVQQNYNNFSYFYSSSFVFCLVNSLLHFRSLTQNNSRKEIK